MLYRNKHLGLFSVLFALLITCSHAKDVSSLATWSIPDSVQQKLQMLNTNTAFPCGGTASAKLDAALINSRNQKMIVVALPNYLCNFHLSAVLLIDQDNQFSIGEIFEGVLSEVTPTSKGLVMTYHWQIEGVFPAIYYSENGHDWSMIALPKDRQSDCCFDQIELQAIVNSQFFIQFTQQEQIPSTIWSVGVSEIETSKEGARINWTQEKILTTPTQQDPSENVNWRKLTFVKSEPINNNGDSNLWLIKDGEHHWQIELPVYHE